ncbi:MAG TPA: hypothetical protein PKG54_01305 [Phycisphaerae bacterium]|jgi:hypothetical protein|nr:hypothetical protein [Phycisphaerae bacterium]HOL27195.1 hypothetical protein [Phycisphaerae bacterium]HPP22910.1 hypothetical protein [Phycisphaerae bacterium]HQA44455.1 hypothetical protein [Phycisphaerae bacterium]HXK87179.1 hypothetical protein [Phycisphaerae bacterium]
MFRLQSTGLTLAYLMAVLSSPWAQPARAEVLTTELASKLLILHPSHGSYWDNFTRSWLRSMRPLCGPNPATNCPPDWEGSTYKPSDYYYWTRGFQWGSFCEDDMTPEIARFVEKYVASSGAEVWVSRNLDKNAGDFDYDGYGYPNCSFPLPKWQTAAKYYLQDRGDIPISVWNPPLSEGRDEEETDLYAKAYYANYRMLQKFPGQDQSSPLVWGHCVSISIHSNAGTFDTARGMETYWDTRYSYLQEDATRLAGNINSGVVSSIRNLYDGFWADAMYPVGAMPPEWPPDAPYAYDGYAHAGDSKTCWQDRGLKTKMWTPEILDAKMPAVLCEVAFHDNWKFYPDHVFMMDQIWRATVAWGFYEGICHQFNATPKPHLAADVVSVNFPVAAAPDQTIKGSITMRNLGMAWCWGHKFTAATKQYAPYTVWRLQATPADQFVPGAKITLPPDVIIYPGENVTFDVTLTAPATPGVCTTEWRMVKDDAMGGEFGAIASAQIRNCSNSVALGDFDTDCDVDADDLALFVDCAAGPMLSIPEGCATFDLDGDNDVDQDDFGIFQRCFSGEGDLPNAACRE